MLFYKLDVNEVARIKSSEEDVHAVRRQLSLL